MDEGEYTNLNISSYGGGILYGISPLFHLYMVSCGIHQLVPYPRLNRS